LQRRRQITEAGKRLRAEDAEFLEDRVVAAAYPVDELAAPVAGVQQGTEVVAVPALARLGVEDRVDLIEEHSWLLARDRSEERRVGEFMVEIGSRTSSWKTSSSRVLPDSGSAEQMNRYGVAYAASIAHVCAIQSVIALACASSTTTKRRTKSSTASRRELGSPEPRGSRFDSVPSHIGGFAIGADEYVSSRTRSMSLTPPCPSSRS
jgi:hypothetical protein